MSETKFTPGPWHIRQDWDGMGILVDCGDPTNLATVGNVASVTDYAPFMSLSTQQEEKRAIAEANARLIAAAPDMHEALKAIVDCYGLGQSPEKFVEQVRGFIEDGRAAISKAKGQP